jgi:hypothetical protein
MSGQMSDVRRCRSVVVCLCSVTLGSPRAPWCFLPFPGFGFKYVSSPRLLQKQSLASGTGYDAAREDRRYDHGMRNYKSYIADMRDEPR